MRYALIILDSTALHDRERCLLEREKHQIRLAATKSADPVVEAETLKEGCGKQCGDQVKHGISC